MPRNKLSVEQVIETLTTSKHISARELARRWGVSHACVNLIRQNKSWRSHVQLLGLPLFKKNDKETIPAEEEKTLQPTQ